MYSPRQTPKGFGFIVILSLLLAFTGLLLSTNNPFWGFSIILLSAALMITSGIYIRRETKKLRDKEEELRVKKAVATKKHKHNETRFIQI